MPDAAVFVGGRATTLQREVVGACFTLLVCDRSARGARADRGPGELPRDLLRVRRLVTSADARDDADALVDESGVAFERLGIRESGIYLVRPDGYVAYRCAATALDGVEGWLAAL